MRRWRIRPPCGEGPQAGAAAGTGAEPRPVLRVADVVPLAALGTWARPARALLSATGIALGIATIVSVLGISASSRAQLVAEIDALGTNLLTVSPGQLLPGQDATLPATAPAMIRKIGPVLAASAIGDVNASVYRNDRIPAVNTNAIAVYSARPSLLGTIGGRMARGRFLTAATRRYPVVVLGADAATALGIDRADGTVQLWLGGHWFSVVGILEPLPLTPELNRAVLVGVGVAEHLLRSGGRPAEVYVRTDPVSVAAVEAVLPATADPAAPQDVAVSDPADALIARADASVAFQGLLIGLGAVALLVGGIGIANVMIIAVLERRGEIGLRRALGASRQHVAVQFIAEAVLLASSGGAVGATLGGFATTMYAAARHWSAIVPAPALLAAVGVAVATGAVAGAYPAWRAATLAPAEALRII